MTVCYRALVVAQECLQRWVNMKSAMYVGGKTTLLSQMILIMQAARTNSA
jgi:hypothetical protein